MILLLTASSAAAAPSRFRFAPSQQAITVTPVIAEVEADAGDTVSTEVTVLNQTERSFSFATGFQDVTPAKDPTRDVDFADSGTTESGAGAWMRTASDSFKLKAGAERDIRVDIAVPQNASSGGHYGALVIAYLPTAGAGGITVQTNLQVVILVRVSGRVRHDLRLQLRPARDFALRGPLSWKLELVNRGNIHENIAGRLRIDPLLGGATSRSLRPMILLPGARREQRISTDPRSAPNLFRADVRLRGASTGKTPSASGWVLLLPIWVLVVLVIAVAALMWRRRRPAFADSDEEFEP